MKGKLKSKQLAVLLGSINRSAPLLTKDAEDSYLVRLGIDMPEPASNLTYQQLSNVLLKFQEFVSILPASLDSQFIVELSAAAEPKNVFLEAVKADYEAKTKEEEKEETEPAAKVPKAAS